MKKSVIAILLIMMLSACKAGSLSSQPSEEQPSSIDITSIPAVTSESSLKMPESSITVSEPTPTTAESNPTPQNDVLTEDVLIGIWHSVPYLPSGYADCHQFYADGQYLFIYNQMATLNQIKRSSNFLFGTWKLEENSIIVSIFSQDFVEGGQIEHGEGYYIKDGTWKMETFPPIEVIYKIDDLDYRIFEDYPEWWNETPKPFLSMHFGNALFWKIDDEPDLSFLGNVDN